MATAREMARTKRRQEIIAAAAKIMAERGFHQTRLGDVGAAVGISGPGLYRHFDSKEALLAEILTEISIRLVDGAREAFQRHEHTADSDPRAVLDELIALHVEVAVTEADLIRVQDREIGNLEKSVQEKVRSLQRTYLGLWADALQRARPDLDRATARIRVQLVAGLVNSARYVLHWADLDELRREVSALALAALLVE